MKLIYLKDVAKAFDLTEDEAHTKILNRGNMDGVKLLHKIENSVVVPEVFYNRINETIDAMANSLTEFSKIRSDAKNYIPVINDSCVYYLFRGFELVYIGQSTCILGRLNQHISDGKIFNRVYLEPTDSEMLLLTEKFYIHRDMPKLNVAVMNNVEYFKQILDLVNLDSLAYSIESTV